MVAGGIFMTEVLRLSMSMTVWLIGFSAVYALQGLACSRHWPADIEARPILIVAWAVVVVLQALIMVVLLSYPSRSRYVQTVTVALAATGIVAAIWTFMPIAAASICL
jgi:hypothetical protein